MRLNFGCAVLLVMKIVHKAEAAEDICMTWSALRTIYTCTPAFPEASCGVKTAEGLPPHLKGSVSVFLSAHPSVSDSHAS